MRIFNRKFLLLGVWLILLVSGQDPDPTPSTESTDPVEPTDTETVIEEDSTAVTGDEESGNDVEEDVEEEEEETPVDETVDDVEEDAPVAGEEEEGASVDEVVEETEAPVNETVEEEEEDPVDETLDEEEEEAPVEEIAEETPVGETDDVEEEEAPVEEIAEETLVDETDENEETPADEIAEEEEENAPVDETAEEEEEDAPVDETAEEEEEDAPVDETVDEVDNRTSSSAVCAQCIDDGFVFCPTDNSRIGTCCYDDECGDTSTCSTMYTDYSAKYAVCPYEPICNGKTYVAGQQLRTKEFQASDFYDGTLCNFEIKFPKGVSANAFMTVLITVEDMEPPAKVYFAQGESSLLAQGDPDENNHVGHLNGNEVATFPDSFFFMVSGKDGETSGPILTIKYRFFDPGNSSEFDESLSGRQPVEAELSLEEMLAQAAAEEEARM